MLQSEELNRAFLDYDANANWFLRTRGIWEANRELIRIEVKRLQKLNPKLGKGLIMKSSDKGNYQVRFPDARLTKEQELNVLIHSLSHRGHVWFSCAVRDTCLRVSSKSNGKVYEPYLVEVIPIE